MACVLSKHTVTKQMSPCCAAVWCFTGTPLALKWTKKFAPSSECLWMRRCISSTYNFRFHPHSVLSASSHFTFLFLPRLCSSSFFLPPPSSSALSHSPFLRSFVFTSSAFPSPPVLSAYRQAWTSLPAVIYSA